MTADEQANMAMNRLRAAIEAGYQGAAQIKVHKDLDVRRQREDFQTLIAALEGA